MTGTITVHELKGTISVPELKGSATMQQAASGGCVMSESDKVYTANQPPSIDAGVDGSCPLPASYSLDATLIDDGIGGPVTFLWTKISGPGVVTFDDDEAIDTSVSFSVDGTYLLRITVDDGQFQHSNDRQITVNPAPTLVTDNLVFHIAGKWKDGPSGDLINQIIYSPVKDAAPVNGPVFSTDHGGSYICDPGDHSYLLAPFTKAELLGVNNAFTISVWLYPLADDTNGAFQMSTQPSSGGPFFYIKRAGAPYQIYVANFGYIITGLTAPKNALYNIVVTYRGDEGGDGVYQSYVNKAAFGSYTAGVSSASADELYPGEGYLGSADHEVIATLCYNDKLTAAEVVNNYDVDLPGFS